MIRVSSYPDCVAAFEIILQYEMSLEKMTNQFDFIQEQFSKVNNMFSMIQEEANDDGKLHQETVQESTSRAKLPL